MSMYDDLPNPPRVGAPKPERKSLGKLTSSARGKELKSARNILIALGILQLIIGGALFAMVPSMVDGMIQNGQVAAEQRDEAISNLRVGMSLPIGLGILFLVFAGLVQKFPVPITVAALVIYLAVFAMDAVADPTQIARGIIIKILIVAALVKAVQAALAEQKARSQGAYA